MNTARNGPRGDRSLHATLEREGNEIRLLLETCALVFATPQIARFHFLQ